MPFDNTPRALFRDDALYRERLLGLCRILENISDDAFDLRDWAKNGSCRSVACAVGWAMRDDWFKGQGLGRQGRSPAFGALKGWRPCERSSGCRARRVSICSTPGSTTTRTARR